MSNRTYDILKWIALVLLPALAALYGSLANVWCLPYCKEVVSSVSAVDAFMGALLGIASNVYSKKEEEGVAGND